MNALLVLSTFPDIEKARQIGTALVESQLAACVNLIPAIESIYRWQGALEHGTEVLAIFKTTSAAYAAFEARLKMLHPYEVPEIVAVKPGEISASYAAWLQESVIIP
jgi:periplasmic divalent cation tolerance protein